MVDGDQCLLSPHGEGTEVPGPDIIRFQADDLLKIVGRLLQITKGIAAEGGAVAARHLENGAAR